MFCPSYLIKGMKPTRANKTGKSTAADSVMTPDHIAKAILLHYKPNGSLLDPARGTGAFYNKMSGKKDWCEIKDGRDFLKYKKKVDWIITNPPYSIYDEFLKHSFEVSDNVVFLCPIAKAFKSLSLQKLVNQYGGLKEIWMMGGGSIAGFSFGFPIGCLHYQRDYMGDIKFTQGLL
jgi:hypothetical protein